MSALNRSIESIRAEFPGLAGGWASLDGAAGTQVPAAVIEAIAAALRDGMANVHGAFAASERSTAIVEEARRAVADLVNGTPEGVVLGPEHDDAHLPRRRRPLARVVGRRRDRCHVA